MHLVFYVIIPAQVACCISKLQFRSIDTPTYRILWHAATIALPGLQDFQVSVSIHITAEFMRSSQLHLNNLIDGHAHLSISNA